MNAVQRSVYTHELVLKLSRNVLHNDAHLDGSPLVHLGLHLFSQLKLIVQLFQIASHPLTTSSLVGVILFDGNGAFFSFSILFKVFFVFFLGLVFFVEAIWSVGGGKVAPC